MRGDGRVYQRGRRFWINYRAPGPDGRSKQFWESAGNTEKQAEKLLGRRIREKALHREGVRRFQGPEKERVTVGEVLDALLRDYETREIKSLRQVRVHVKPLRAHFGGWRAVAVTPDRVREYVATRQATGKAAATINRETEILGRAFRLAVDDGRLAFAPKMPALREDNARKGFFEKADFDALAPRLPDPLDDAARFGYMTGWREGEILGLRWEWIDRAAQEIRLPDSKNGEGRTLFLDEESWQLIERRWSAREYETPAGPALSAYVFHRKGRPISPSQLLRAWRRASIAANLGRYVKDARGRLRYEGKLFHDLRRTAVRDMIRAGVAQSVAMKISGHKTVSMFSRYNITSGEDVREALTRRRAYVEARAETRNVVPMRKAANADRNADK